MSTVVSKLTRSPLIWASSWLPHPKLVVEGISFSRPSACAWRFDGRNRKGRFGPELGHERVRAGIFVATVR